MAIQLPFCVRPLALGTITTGNQRTNRPAAHLAEHKDVGMVWQSNGNGSLWIRGDFGSAKSVDFVSLMSANAQAGTTIRVRLGDTQAEVDGTADYDSGALTFISPAITRADGLYNSHLEIPAVYTKRWWRIDIGGHTGDFEASTLIMGRRFTPARFYDRGWEYGVEDMGALSFGNYGVVTDEEGIVLRTLKFRLSWLTEAEWETRLRPILESVGQRGFLFWCFDPEPTVYRQDRTYFGPTIKTPAVVAGVKPGTFGSEFAVSSPYGASPDEGGEVLLPTLGPLSLSSSSVDEGTAAGVTVGSITGGQAGSIFSITDTAGSRFALSGTNVQTGATATDYETATSHNITLRETNSGYSNSPRDTVIAITVNDVAEGGGSIDSIVIEGDSITSTNPSTYSSSFYSYQYDDYRTDKTIEVRAQGSRVVGQSANLNDNGNSLMGNVAEDIAYGPDLITYMIGANDMAVSRTAAQHRGDLELLYDSYKAADASVKIAWSPPIAYNPTGTPHPNYTNFMTQRASILSTCRTLSVWQQWADYYIPMGEHPNFGDASIAAPLFGDSVHPSAAGQLLLFAVYKAAMDTILDATRATATAPYNAVWPTSETNLAVGVAITRRFILSGLQPNTHHDLSVTGAARLRRNENSGAGTSSIADCYNGDVIDLLMPVSASYSTPVSYDLTLGSETRTITLTTAADVPQATYTQDGTATSTASATSQSYTNRAFSAGIPVLFLTSYSNAGGATDSGPTSVTLTPTGGGSAITLTKRFEQIRGTAASRAAECWSGSGAISAGNYDIAIARANAASHNAITWGVLHDADPAPVDAQGNTPAEPSVANHSTPSVTVPNKGIALAAYFIEDDTTPDAVTVSSPSTELAEVVAINTAGVGLCTASRITTGSVEFTHKTGTYARLIVVWKAAGT